MDKAELTQRHCSPHIYEIEKQQQSYLVALRNRVHRMFNRAFQNRIIALDTRVLQRIWAGVAHATMGGRGRLVCHLDYLPLKPGTYLITIKLWHYIAPSRYQKADVVINAAKFEVVEGGDSGFIEYGKAPVVVPHRRLLSSDCTALRT